MHSVHTRRHFLQSLCASAFVLPSVSKASPHTGFIDSDPVERFFHNATLLDGEGKVHTEVGIHLRKGKVQTVSKSIVQGENLKGQWIVPSWTDAGATLGMFEVGLEAGTHQHKERKFEKRERLIPAHSYRPLSETVPVARSAGFSHVLLHPSFGDLVVGQVSLVQTAGLVYSDATIQDSVGLLLSMQKNDGATTRMGIVQQLKDLFSEYSPTSPPKGIFAPKNHDPYAGFKEEQAIWTKMRDKRLPLIVSAHQVDDIAILLSLKEEFNLPLIIMGGAEAWLLAEELAKANVSVILGPLDIQPSSFTHLHARYENAALLHKAGVSIAFRSGENHHIPQMHFRSLNFFVYHIVNRMF